MNTVKIYKNLLGGIVIMLFLFSCVSAPEEPAGNPVSSDNTESTENARPRVKVDKNTGNSPEAMMWNTLPVNNHPVFFAAARRQADRDSEIDMCITEAANQASMFIVLSAKAQTTEQRAGRSTGYAANVDIGYDIELADSLIDEIEILETYQDSDGTYMKAVFSSVKSDPLRYNLGASSSKPSWISSPPVINGYYSAVGTVRRSSSLPDSIYKVDGQALVELLKQIAITIQSAKEDKQNETGSTIADQTSTQVSSGIIKGFFVVSRWAPVNGSYYYALAVCTEGKEQ